MLSESLGLVDSLLRQASVVQLMLARELKSTVDHRHVRQAFVGAVGGGSDIVMAFGVTDKVNLVKQ